MPPIIQFNQTQDFAQVQKRALSQAKNELKAPRIDVKEYAQRKNIDTMEAKELDLNNDNKISIWERASQIIADSKYSNSNTQFAPTMVVNFIYQVGTDFAQKEYAYLKSIDEAPRQREKIQHLV